MYFSVISPAEERVRAAVRDMAHAPYGMHQWLWKFFEGDPDAARDFIFRRHDVDHLPRVYVVSARPPAAFSDDWEVRTRPYDPQLQAEQRLSFVLCANPVVSKKGVDGKSRRHDVVMQAKKDSANAVRAPAAELVEQTCLAWLRARAGKAGFELVGAAVGAYRQQQENRRPSGHPIQFSSVEFSGELVVRDPVDFRRTLLEGLGHAKAFGCGLMLVKNVSEH